MRPHRHQLEPVSHPRPRWGWLAVVTVLAALTGAWISAEAGVAPDITAYGVSLSR